MIQLSSNAHATLTKGDLDYVSQDMKSYKFIDDKQIVYRMQRNQLFF